MYEASSLSISEIETFAAVFKPYFFPTVALEVQSFFSVPLKGSLFSVVAVVKLNSLPTSSTKKVHFFVDAIEVHHFLLTYVHPSKASFYYLCSSTWKSIIIQAKVA